MMINGVNIFCLVFLAILVHSIPSSFTVISLAKETFNSSGVSGSWEINKDKIHADQEKNCQYWDQSDKEILRATFAPTQRVDKAWIEIEADV